MGAIFSLDESWLRRPDSVVEDDVLMHIRELARHVLESMVQAFEAGLERFLIRKGREGLRCGRYLVVVDVHSQVHATENE